MKKKLIISSIASIALLGSIVAGGTYALFTSETSANINVTSGTVNYTSSIENIKVYSMGREQTGLIFENGGSVSLDSEKNILTFTNITPGDKVTFDYKIVNNSNVRTLYRITPKITIHSPTDYNLYRNIRTTGFAGTRTTGWVAFDIPGSEAEREIVKSLEFYLPEDAGNEAQGGSVQYSIEVEAIQENGFTQDDFRSLEIIPETKTVNIWGYNGYYEFTKRFDAYWDDSWLSDTETLEYHTFINYTVNLMNDIDLRYNEFDNFMPIGRAGHADFRGVFDGQNHVIKNFKSVYKEGNEAINVGVFGHTYQATVKNVIVDSPYIKADWAIGGVIGCASSTYIENCKLTGNAQIKGVLGKSGFYVGGIVGQLTFASDDGSYVSIVKDCEVDVEEGSIVQASGMYAGGIVGWVGENARNQIINCKSNIDVSSDYYPGGIIGYAQYNTDVINCIVTDVVITKTFVGDAPDYEDMNAMGAIAGGAGYAGNSTPVLIKDCTFTGTLVNLLDADYMSRPIHKGVVGTRRGRPFDQQYLKIENVSINENLITLYEFDNR
ncbi:MAG: SipW-dependent-type signal peptide-containing protein [Candidatus Onthovivens sp.]|nr:SipW-dependent-type signal peptide-containing protein [Candidatus Onthovivens sp.]